MPISWKGTLQQYAGRLHRNHEDKESIRIYDYTENNQPLLRRMWEKRLKGYKPIGYSVGGEGELFDGVRVAGDGEVDIKKASREKVSPKRPE